MALEIPMNEAWRKKNLGQSKVFGAITTAAKSPLVQSLLKLSDVLLPISRISRIKVPP
jgi:hypothetical protein